jgi:putative ABC transport system permease protein
MNFIENIKEGWRSIRGSLLRNFLTALIIAIGITALVGMQTTVDGIQTRVNSNFASLGANSFDIKGPEMFRRRRSGLSENKFPPVEYREALQYQQMFANKTTATVSLYTGLTGIAEIKFESKKTNPNSRVMGGDENYLPIKGYEIDKGRNISKSDVELAQNVAVIGQELVKSLFQNRNPINQQITVLGQKMLVIGTLAKKGSLSGSTGNDRIVALPLTTARNLAGERRRLTIDITTSVPEIKDMDFIMAEAESIMRRVRGDEVGQVNSFEIKRADSFAKDFESISGKLSGAGLLIGIVTLLGAAIALMNSMLVAVTERTREIGIRKSIGATSYQILLQFLFEAILICILGGLMGLVLGLSVGNVFSGLIADTKSFVVPWGWIIGANIACVFVGLVSGIYPAWKASRLDPIEALRYE